MAFKAITSISTVEYIHPSDDQTNPTIFVLGAISASDMMKANGTLIGFKQVIGKDSDLDNEERAITMNGLVEWARLIIEKGLKEVRNLEGYEWNGEVDTTLINILAGNNILIDIANKLVEINTIGEVSKN